MTRLALVTLGLAALSACVFVDDRDRGRDDDWQPPPVVRNRAPIVRDAASWCAYDDFNRDDVWFFDAVVDDPDGVLDVTQVWADVYDERSGILVQSFALYPTDDAFYWFSDWLVSSTLLDCWYPRYVVNLVAYDSADATSVLSIYPATYR